MSAAVFVVSAAILASLSGHPDARRPEPDQKPAKERIRSVRLEQPTDVQGVSCTRRVFYNADDSLRSCILARDTTFANGLVLPAGAQVSFDRQRLPDMAFLPAHRELDGHLCAGDGPGGMMTNFYPTGRVRFCNLTRPAVIDGIPCQKTTFWMAVRTGHSGVYFHEDGRLHACLLSEATTIDGKVVPARTVVRFDRDGHLQRGTSPE